MYEKVEYIWDPPRPSADRSDLTFTSVHTGEQRAVFEQAVYAVLDGSLDRADQAALRAGDRKAHAERLSRPDGGFRYETHWWSLAYDPDGNIVGIVQPVVFVSADRDGHPEGTIHYVGVLPAFRGRGYISDLLAKGTNVLAHLGVWRIYADSDVRNAPMRQAFLRLGYREGRVRSVPLPDTAP
jgi:GNAT superfamily N-acetyltransferase